MMCPGNTGETFTLMNVFVLQILAQNAFLKQGCLYSPVNAVPTHRTTVCFINWANTRQAIAMSSCPTEYV